MAAGFTTGANAAGYTLSSFALHTTLVTATDNLTVTLNESATDASNNTVPGTAVCTLTKPAMTAEGGLTSFAAPEECGTLAANTTYFVVFARGSSATWSSLSFALTGSDEDAGAASGWSISNGEVYQAQGSSDWTVGGSTPVIEVKGTIKEPALVSNLAETVTGDTGAINSTRSAVAQAFTTGSNPGGYSLASVEVNVKSTPSDTSGITVSISTASGNNPGTHVHALTKPASLHSRGDDLHRAVRREAGRQHHLLRPDPQFSRRHRLRSQSGLRQRSDRRDGLEHR